MTETAMNFMEATRDTSPQELHKSSLKSIVYLFNEWATEEDCIVYKSWYHPDGSRYYSGERFIIYAQTPFGTIVDYRENEHWDLFQIPERATGPNLDLENALESLFKTLGQEH
jgi:hypothetical protein